MPIFLIQYLLVQLPKAYAKNPKAKEINPNMYKPSYWKIVVLRYCIVKVVKNTRKKLVDINAVTLFGDYFIFIINFFSRLLA